MVARTASPIAFTWPIDDTWVGIRCQKPGCPVEGAISITHRGDINVDADMRIRGGWCGEHVPAELRRRDEPSDSEQEVR